jgi:hypothetical protein
VQARIRHDGSRDRSCNVRSQSLSNRFLHKNNRDCLFQKGTSATKEICLSSNGLILSPQDFYHDREAV